MQFRTLCLIFTILITVAFMTPTQAVVAKTTTDSSKSDTKKKSTKKKSSKKKSSKKKDKKSSKKGDSKKKDSKKKSTKKSSKKSDSKKKTTKKSSKKPSKAFTGKININTATAKELALIPGVGPVTAKSIIAYRKKNGKFKSSKDLLNVKGIGEKTMKKMKSQVKL